MPSPGDVERQRNTDFGHDLDTRRPEGGIARADRRIAALAAGQHGTVGPWQLRAIGVDAARVRLRVAAGRLHPLPGGVLAVGHAALSADGRRMAAVLAGGPRAALSHRSAAALHGLRGSAGMLEISVPSTAGVAVAGLRVHRTPSLTREDVVRVRGIPCTTVARTILDCAATLDRVALDGVLRRADLAGALDLRAFDDLLRRVARPRGVRRLRAALERFTPGTAPDEGIEEAFERFCLRFGLPQHTTQVWRLVAGRHRRLDCFWAAEGVVVELDGRDAHQRVAAFAEDRRRDRELATIGLQTLRLTSEDLRGPRAATTARELRAVLAARRVSRSRPESVFL